MAKKRIVAHFMHEEERQAAKKKMNKIEETESYLLGEVEESDIPELQKKGLIIQAIEEEKRTDRPTPLLRTRRRGTRQPPSSAPVVDMDKPNFYLLTLRGPLLSKWRKQLTELEIELLESVAKNVYSVKLDPEQVTAVNSLTFVSRVELYGSRDQKSFAEVDVTPPKAGVDRPPEAGRPMATYDIRLHREEDAEKVLDWLRAHNISVVGARGRKIRVYLLKDTLLVDKVKDLSEVASIDIYVQPRLHNDVARHILGIDSGGPDNPLSNIPYTGDGQIVAVADTGIDENHPDFQGRIVGTVARGRPNDCSDPNGHGTHVAGSVLGSGNASGKIKGAAPKAKLFFQSILDYQDGLVLPMSLDTLFEEAYQAGARIHNNSWGAATGSVYTSDANEVDDFVSRRRDMLIVISAGNDGQAADCRHSKRGYVDWLSIESPASAKNALTVGASRSKRTNGGYAQLKWGTAWPSEFPDSPIAAEYISGNPEGLAAFSSRGPCLDHRIKPDVVAPGTDIASTKSSRAPLSNFWGPYPGNNNYAFMGGTSMSAPLVAGCAAVVREYYVKDRNHEPSAALLKATLINSARGLTGQDAMADHPYQPNFHQGFGCVYMPWAIPNPSEPDLKLEFVDTWKEPQQQFGHAGQMFQFKCTVATGRALRVCLTWTDPPGRAVQNNLNLFAEHIQSHEKHQGNEKIPLALGDPDPDNNVEVIRVENPQAGEYLFQITATNILKFPQDFALVVTGDLRAQLKRH